MFKKFMQRSEDYYGMGYALHKNGKKAIRYGLMGLLASLVIIFLMAFVFGQFFSGMLGNIIGSIFELTAKASVIVMVGGAIAVLLSYLSIIFNTPHKVAIGIFYGILIMLMYLSKAMYEARDITNIWLCITSAYTILEVFRLLWLDIPDIIKDFKKDMEYRRLLKKHRYDGYNECWSSKALLDIYKYICRDIAAVMTLYAEYYLITTGTWHSTMIMIIVALLLNPVISGLILKFYYFDYALSITPAIILIAYGLIGLMYCGLYLMELQPVLAFLKIAGVIFIISAVLGIIQGCYRMRRIKKNRGY